MKSKKREFNIREIFEKLNIEMGDKILVSSNILKILIQQKKIDSKFNANLIIDTLKEKLGKKGTLLFPTYNWDFCKGKEFDYKKTLSLSGSLGNIALNRKDFKRTKNPIYSFAVTGKDRDHICNLKHKSCFGLNSPFGYLIENHGKNLFIGIDYKKGFTFVHAAEEAVGVDYRYYKDFHGYYIDRYKKKNKVNYKMLVRNLNLNVGMTVIDKRFDNILIKKKAYEKKIINGITFILIDIYKAYKAMTHELRLKKGLIYPSTKV